MYMPVPRDSTSLAGRRRVLMTPEQPDSPSPGRLRPVSSRQNALVKELRRAFAHSGPADDGRVGRTGPAALRVHAASR